MLDRDDRQDENDPLNQFMHEQIVTMVAADGELIWLRYTAMLAANSLVGVAIGAVITRSPFERRDVIILAVASVFGLVLSWHWYWLTKHGWAIQQAYVRGASKYSWKNHTPVFELYHEWCRENPPPLGRGMLRSRAQTGVMPAVDMIEHHAMGVIRLFIAAYLGCLAFVILHFST